MERILPGMLMLVAGSLALSNMTTVEILSSPTIVRVLRPEPLTVVRYLNSTKNDSSDVDTEQLSDISDNSTTLTPLEPAVNSTLPSAETPLTSSLSHPESENSTAHIDGHNELTDIQSDAPAAVKPADNSTLHLSHSNEQEESNTVNEAVDSPTIDHNTTLEISNSTASDHQNAGNSTTNEHHDDTGNSTINVHHDISNSAISDFLLANSTVNHYSYGNSSEGVFISEEPFDLSNFTFGAGEEVIQIVVTGPPELDTNATMPQVNCSRQDFEDFATAVFYTSAGPLEAAFLLYNSSSLNPYDAQLNATDFQGLSLLRQADNLDCTPYFVPGITRRLSAAALASLAG